MERLRATTATHGTRDGSHSAVTVPTTSSSCRTVQQRAQHTAAAPLPPRQSAWGLGAREGRKRRHRRALLISANAFSHAPWGTLCVTHIFVHHDNALRGSPFCEERTSHCRRPASLLQGPGPAGSGFPVQLDLPGPSSSSCVRLCYRNLNLRPRLWQ
jgi:hypothetical protein